MIVLRREAGARSVKYGQRQATLLSLLEAVPWWPVLVHRCDVGTIDVINTFAMEKHMDLITHLDPAAAKTLVQAESPADRFFIAPSAGNLPVDDLFEYVDVLSIDDVIKVITKAKAEDNKVVAVFDVSNDSVARLLTVLCEYSDLFNCEPTVITGITGADYSIKWEEATFNKPRISYIEIVDTVAEAKRVADITPKEKGEKAKVQRSVKLGAKSPEFNKFNVNLFEPNANAAKAAEDLDPGLAD